MHDRKASVRLLSSLIIAGLPYVAIGSAYAATSGAATPVESFIKSVIQVLAGLAGLVATGFFVVGGFGFTWHE
jgi:hypothetical protein